MLARSLQAPARGWVRLAQHTTARCKSGVDRERGMEAGSQAYLMLYLLASIKRQYSFAAVSERVGLQRCAATRQKIENSVVPTAAAEARSWPVAISTAALLKRSCAIARDHGLISRGGNTRSSNAAEIRTSVVPIAAVEASFTVALVLCFGLELVRQYCSSTAQGSRKGSIPSLCKVIGHPGGIY